MLVYLGVAASPADPFDIFLQPLDIIFSDLPGVGQQFFTGLHVPKTGFGPKLKVAFDGIQDLKNNDLMLAVPKMLEA